VAFLAQSLSLGLQPFSVGVFMKPMTEDLGWTRGVLTGAPSAGNMLSDINSTASAG
jgi:hypothetical protein